MKTRVTRAPSRRSPEFKGVVKKITGKLTNRPDLEKEGHAEMSGEKRPASRRSPATAKRRSLNPDRYRRG